MTRNDLALTPLRRRHNASLPYPLTITPAPAIAYLDDLGIGYRSAASNYVAVQANQGTLGGQLVQATESAQARVETVNGKPVVYYPGAAFMVANHALASLRFLHDETGSTFMVIAKHVTLATYDTHAGTCRNAASGVGLLSNVNATGVHRTYCGNGGAAFTFQTFSSAGLIVANKPIALTIRHGTVFGGFQVRFNGSNRGAIAAYTSAPSAADPSAALMVGDMPTTDGAKADMYLHALLAWTTPLSDTAIALIEAWAVSEYGAWT